MRNSTVLALVLALCGTAHPQQPNAKAFVLPTKIDANEPFTFGVSGVVEGEVITIQTVQGEVISTQRPRRDGTIFLPAGLALGSYVLSSSKGRPNTRCVVVEGTGGTPPGMLSLIGPPKAIDIGKPLSLSGQGFNPNASDMDVELGSQQVPVLAATNDELVTGPLAGVPTGPCDLYVGNLRTGQGEICPNVLAYSLTSRLVKRRLVGGEQTVLEFRMDPPEATARVAARITSGPVTFPEGKTECTVEVANGLASIAILSQPGGGGTFTIDWEGGGAIFKGDEAGYDPKKQEAKERARQKHMDAAKKAFDEAEKAEKAAKDAEDKGNNDKAAEERGKAADKHKEEAQHLRAAGDSEGAANAEREAAENARKEAEAHDKKGKSQSPGKEARNDAAEAEKRAAQDEQKQATRDANGGNKEKAAEGMDKAADGYDRAAKDYRDNGEGSKAKDMERAAQGARAQAERLRK